MKLLIVTQTVDETHPVLGFFVRWIEEYAKQCKEVTVVCLSVGQHTLPSEVSVHSLGKESGATKFVQLLNFYRFTWHQQKQYDAVFVHMNPIYLILGGVIWRMLGKRVGLWYTHGTVNMQLRIATLLSHYIFTASDNSFLVDTKKKIVTGHGIDTIRFTPKPDAAKTIDIITVGRISKAKNLHTLIKILSPLLMKKKYSLHIFGSPLTNADSEYLRDLHTLVQTEGVSDQVQFHGVIAHDELPGKLVSAKVFVTMAQNGSLDKAMLEAMACGIPIVSTAEGSKSLPLGRNQIVNDEVFAEQVGAVLESGNHVLPEYTQYIGNSHSLELLISSLVSKLNERIPKTSE